MSQPSERHSYEALRQKHAHVALLRPKEAMVLTGLGRTSFYKLMGQDPTFPKPVKLMDSESRGAPVGFVLQEVEAWINRRIQARDGAQ